MRSSIIFAVQAAIAVLVAASALGQSASQPPPSYQFSSGGTALNIPVELVANGLVFVPAKVNDHPGWFILDNARQGFTIDRDYARQLSLQSSGSAAARGGGSDTVQAGVVHDCPDQFAGAGSDPPQPGGD